MSPKSKTVTGVGLFSGGLDSLLAVRLLQQQNIAVEAVAFVTPFFDAEHARAGAELLEIPLHVTDITDQHFDMLKSPRYGYGRNMNPCIDCHALMFRIAGSMMSELNADFLFSGEVLGERPMSQNKKSLRLVAKLSGFFDCIIRPLSAQLLPPTRPEREGLVDRQRLLGIEGRSRKPQIALAEECGISTYPGPAGGCKLTDPGFSKRLKDLLVRDKNPARHELELLSLGRHLRLSEGCRLIVGRNKKENEHISRLCTDRDILLSAEHVPGPAALLCGVTDEQNIGFAASVCMHYSDADRGGTVTVTRGDTTEKIHAEPCSREAVESLLI